VVHDALAVGLLVWPEMFVRSRMALEIVTEGPEAGRSKPMVAKDPRRKLSLVMSLPVGDFLENLLETLCHEKFVV
jgi:inosine-uridine nucleoside N-ribohydrolase